MKGAAQLRRDGEEMRYLDYVISVLNKSGEGAAPAPAPAPAPVGDDKDKDREADYQKRKESLGVGGTQPPSTLVCPLTQELMHDPVTLSSGITYEREAIATWFAGSKRVEGIRAVCDVEKRKWTCFK